MMSRNFIRLPRVWTTAVAALMLWVGAAATAHAQYYEAPGQHYQPLNRFYYYPYYYFAHNYWPELSPKWPEAPGQHYQRPPAYMAYPPFREPHWRYDWWEPHYYYRGFHFWLDQF
jgi:hypothetical protein